MAQVLSRRDRLRAATTDEIKQTARRILVEQGPEAVSLRAIARDMGMTAPALYRYFGSHEDLIKHVVADIFTELADGISAAIAAAGLSPTGPPDITAKFVAAAREFRHWALAHKAEFSLLFGSPLPGLDHMEDDIAADCGYRFAWTFLKLFVELWRKRPFPVPARADIVPALRRQLERYHAALGVDLPVGALLVFLRCWTRLYGIVSLEVFGHLSFALDDTEPMFEFALADLTMLLGLDYQPTALRTSSRR